MSDDPNLHYYVRHFPADGQNLNDGTVKAVHGLAMGMVQCGRRVTVLCEGEQTSTLVTPHGYEIQCFSNQHRFPGRLSKGLKEYTRERRDNMLVVVNGAFHPSVYTMSRWLRDNSIPYIAAPHDPYHPTIFRSNAHLKWPYWYLRERPMLRGARAVQVLDLRHGQWLRKLNVQTPVIEAPNGFFPADVPPESSLISREAGIPRLVFMGRLDSYNKGLDILLAAFARVIKQIPATLAIRGPDHGDAARLRLQANGLGLNGQVEFPGADYTRTGPNILADYDIFCLPSRFEGFGLAALEAMLAARPVLVSDVSGIAPHVHASGCGVVVTPDVASVETGLLTLLRARDEWANFGTRGRRYVLQNLHWNAIASNTLGHLARLAS